MKTYLNAVGKSMIVAIVIMNFFIAFHSFFNGGKCIFTDNQYVKDIVGAMVVGLGYSIPIFIYDLDMHLFIKAIIHMFFGSFTMILTGEYLGWFSINRFTGVITCIAAMVIAFAIYSWHLYNNYILAKKINTKIEKNIGKHMQ